MISLGGPPRSCISPTSLPTSLPSTSSEYPGRLNVSRIFLTSVCCCLYLSSCSGVTPLGGFAR